MAGFGNLRDVPPAEIKQQIEDSGLYCKSSHFLFMEVLGEEPEATADYAAALGLLDVIVSSSGIPGERGEGGSDQFKEWGGEDEQGGGVDEIERYAPGLSQPLGRPGY